MSRLRVIFGDPDPLFTPNIGNRQFRDAVLADKLLALPLGWLNVYCPEWGLHPRDQQALAAKLRAYPGNVCVFTCSPYFVDGVDLSVDEALVCIKGERHPVSAEGLDCLTLGELWSSVGEAGLARKQQC